MGAPQCFSVHGCICEICVTDEIERDNEEFGIVNQLEWIIWTRQVRVGEDYDKEDDNDDENKKQ